MIKIGVYAARDRQFRTLKKISKKLAEATGLELSDIESFVLKQEFFQALLYDSDTELFMRDFQKYLDFKMDVPKSRRLTLLNKRIWGAI